MKKQFRDDINLQLEELVSNGEQLFLRLYPPSGSTIIERNGNRMQVRLDEWPDSEPTLEFEDVSEAFYDKMVAKYDYREVRLRELEELEASYE
jgi:hypothetical protein